MKKTLFAIAALLLATSASAAEGGKPFLGVGAELGLDTSRITVPINVAPVLRIEPFIGLDRTKETDSTDPAGDFIRTDTTFTIGTGAFYLMEVGQNVELIAGGRLTLDNVSFKEQDKAAGTTVDDSRWRVGLAAAGGAEYYFSPRFALGVEAELGFRTEETAPDVRLTTIYTASFVTAKVFFK